MSLLGIFAAPITMILLAATVSVSVWAFNTPRVMDACMLDMLPLIRKRQYYRLVTAGFIHGDGIHLAFNMLTLVFFGPALEGAVGSAAFLLIYVASLLAGSLWAVLEHFRDMNYRALVASGAISGVTVVFALFAPMAMIIVFVLPVPAILYAALYVGWSVYAASAKRNDGIGHAAHLGGALMGIVLTCLLWPQAIRDLIHIL